MFTCAHPPYADQRGRRGEGERTYLRMLDHPHLLHGRLCNYRVAVSAPNDADAHSEIQEFHARIRVYPTPFAARQHVRGEPADAARDVEGAELGFGGGGGGHGERGWWLGAARRGYLTRRFKPCPRWRRPIAMGLSSAGQAARQKMRRLCGAAAPPQGAAPPRHRKRPAGNAEMPRHLSCSARSAQRPTRARAAQTTCSGSAGTGYSDWEAEARGGRPDRGVGAPAGWCSGEHRGAVLAARARLRGPACLSGLASLIMNLE